MPAEADNYGFVPDDAKSDDFGFVPDDDFGFKPDVESPSEAAVIPFPTDRQPPTQTGPTNALELEEQNIRERQQQTFDIAREQERANFTPEQIRRLDTGSVAENLMTAPPGVEAPMVTGEQVMQKFPKLSPTTAKAMAGLLQTGAGAWNFMASPVGAATLPVAAMAGAPGLVGLAGKSVLGTFGLEAFAAAPEAIEQFDTAMRSGDPEKIAQTASQLGLIFAVATGATKGTVESAKGIRAQETSAIASKARMSGLDQSAAALDQLSKDVSQQPIDRPAPDQTVRQGMRPSAESISTPESLRRPNEVQLTEAPGAEQVGVVGPSSRIPREIVVQAEAGVMQALEKYQLAKQRQAERALRSEGGALDVSGETFSGMAKIDPALRTAEQKISARETPLEPTADVPEITTSTPLKDVEQIVRDKLEKRDWASAVSVLGQTKAETNVKVLNKLLGVGKESVPLSAAERMLFEEIWSGALEKNGIKIKLGSSEAGFFRLPEPVREYFASIGKFFTPPSPTAPVEVRIQPGARVPRLQPYEAEKSLASSPQGMARIPGFGKLVDPRARVESPVDSAIITRAYSVSKGKTFAALWGQSQYRSKELFKADKDTGTIPLTNGERGYISDVIESEIRDPGSQKISDAQRTWINDEWLPLLKDVREMLKEEGVTKVQTEDLDFDVANDYFPRPAIGKRNREATPSGQTGGRPGADPFFEKSRKYKTEFEGARRSVGEELKEEIIYDPDAISRATKFITGAYRAVADHRLANDASLGGQTVTERFDALKSNDAARLNALPDEARTEAESQLREQAAYPIWGKEEQLHIAPAFTGKIYPIETSSKLRSAYAQESAGWLKKTSTVTAAAKAMAATLDASAPWIQGAAMMGSNPIRWAKTTWNSYRALVDPNVMGKMLEQPKYRQAAEEFSQSGGTLLQLEDFLSGMGEGTVISKIPVYGKAVQASGRSYGAFMDLAKLELWDAWRDATPREQWGKLAEDVENALFMGRMEKIGLNPGQSVAERLMLFAPIYYRGAGGMVTSAMSRGLSGRRMRQMIGGYAAAGGLVTVAAWNALGLSEEEQLRRIDPRNGTFMKVPIPTGDGKRIEVGIGNVLSQLVRLGGRAFDYHEKDKEIDTGVENNPYLQFLSARAAFVPSLAVEIVMGQDYRGNPLTIKEAVVRKFIPFAFQSMFPNEEVPTSQRMLDAAFSAFGLNAFPESEYASQLRKMDDLSRKEKGKPFLDLPIVDRALAVKSFKESPDFKKRDPSVQDMRRFLKINEDREASLKKRIAPEVRTQLDELGLSIGGYKSTVTLQGIDIPLSHKEQERYEELLAESYNEHASNLPKEAATAKPMQRDKWWSNYQEEIRKTARAKLIVELNQK